METKCQYIDGCPIAKYFGQTGWSVFASRYCRDGKFDECKRYKLRTAGKQVPPHVLPWDKPNA